MTKNIWPTIKKYTQTAFALLILALVLVRFSLFLYRCAVKNEEEPLLIDVLDVGQSDAILLRSGGESLLVDTGTVTESIALLNQLQRLGVTEINTVCVTHPHEDHYGNARGLMLRIPVGSLLVAETEEADDGYRLLLQEAAKEQVEVVTAETGLTLRLGECTVTVLISGGGKGNNASIVLRVVCGATTLLLMGDAESETEEMLLNATDPALLDCDFLKVGHHGSNTATTAEFLAAVTPQTAVISCGKDNDYGFPHAAVLERLRAAGATVYRTDESGTLHFASDGKSVYEREMN